MQKYEVAFVSETMARLRQSLLVSRSNWWFGGMLLVLHAALAWGIDSLVARAMLIVHFGVFLMWHPLWRGERSIETRHAFVIIVVGIMLTGWSNWWLMAVWLVVAWGMPFAPVQAPEADATAPGDGATAASPSTR